MLEASEWLLALLQGKHKTAGIPMSGTEVLYVCSWAQELLVELPQVQSRQKVLALQFILAWKPQARIFNDFKKNSAGKLLFYFLLSHSAPCSTFIMKMWYLSFPRYCLLWWTEGFINLGELENKLLKWLATVYYKTILCNVPGGMSVGKSYMLLCFLLDCCYSSSS